MIQNFLDSGLLDIDDENTFNYLIETAEELSAILLENPSKVISYTLMALDPNAPVDDPVFNEVEELLKNRWKFLRRRYPDRPTEFLRSIIFQALELASADNKTIIGLIWLTAKSFIPFAKLYGDIDLYRNFVEMMGIAFESDISISTSFDVTLLKTKSRQFTKANLEIEIASIISNRYKDKEISNDRNPNPIYRNDYFPLDNWINEFVPRATSLLLKALGKIQEDTSSIQIEVAKLMERFITQADGQRIKTDILWWKQALYSPRLARSYRDLPPYLACIVMALDLSDIISSPYPISVDYIFKETIQDLFEATDKNNNNLITFAELLQTLVTPNLQDTLRELTNNTECPNGRTSLLKFLSAFVHGNCQNAEEITSKVGVNLSDKITLPDFGVWLFCDLQAEKLLQGREDL